MTDLRTGLVEAIAKVIWHMSPCNKSWDYVVQTSELAVDRVLGFLSTNADEWEEAAFQVDEPAMAVALIAVLSDRVIPEKPEEETTT